MSSLTASSHCYHPAAVQRTLPSASRIATPETADLVSISSPAVALTPSEIAELRRFTLSLDPSVSPSASDEKDDFEPFKLAPPPTPQGRKRAKSDALLKKLSATMLGQRWSSRERGRAQDDEVTHNAHISLPLTPTRDRSCHLATMVDLPTPKGAKAPRRFQLFSQRSKASLFSSSYTAPVDGSAASPSATSASSANSPPPSYREIQLQESWAAVGLDINDPKMGPKPHCTPEEWAAAFNDFFGAGSSAAQSKTGKKHRMAGKVRTDGWA